VGLVWDLYGIMGKVQGSEFSLDIVQGHRKLLGSGIHLELIWEERG